MKKWIKRVSTGITSLCMLLTLLPSAPAAASNFVEQGSEKEVRASDEIYESGGEVTATESQSLPRAMAEPPDQLLTLDGLIYDLYEEEAWVVGSTSVVSGALTIPDEILGITVTTIGDRAFYDQDKLTEVYIGDNVTSVGVRAFANCDNLQTVRLGEGITELPTSLFEKCKNLSNITIGSRVRRVGYRAFYYCTSLTTFTFPETMASVETESFYYCSGLKEIRFEGYPRALSQWIFYNVTATVFYPKGSDGVWCDSTYPMIGGNLTWKTFETDHIPGAWRAVKEPTLEEEGACELRCVDCDHLMAQDTLEKLVGGQCGDDLTWLLNPNSGLMTISGTGAMYDYNWSGSDPAPWYQYSGKLKKVVVEEGVTRIGDSAFYLCRSLEKITLAKTVTSVGFEVISYCENLSTATSYFGVQKATYLGTNDNPYYALVEITDDSPWGNSEEYPTFTLNVTSGCVVISDFLYAYANTYDFGVKMPDSVLYIGQRALMSCKSFNLPKNLITIGEYAFAYSDHAGDIKIPSTVKSVGENAFCDCDNLQFVEIPDTMTSIPYGMFYDCNGLRKVTFGGNLESIGAQAFYYCDGLTSLSIPDSVTQIGYGAFEQCRGLTTVRVGTGLKKSESRAFFNCIAIKHVYIKDMAAWCDIDFANSDANPYIYAEYLYLNGTLLDHIVIPEGVTKIGAYAFTSYWMNRLQVQKLTIPASVKSVSDSAFANCSIRHIYISDLKAWCDLSTGKNGFITIAPSYLYLNGEMVTHLEVPEGVISLRPNAFRYLGGIEKVTLPQSLETIGQWAFYCCPDLKEITIADGVTQIGEYAFDYGVCERSIHFLGDAPALAGSPGVSNKVTYICYNSDAKGWTEEYKALWRDEYTWVPDHSVSGYTSDGNGTCTEDGTQTGNCQYCGASVTILQPSVGHTPGEWITTEEATPEHNGVKQRRCTVCDELLETAEINRCAFGTCGENLSWYLDLVTGELTVSGSGAMVSGSDTAIPWVSYRDRITVAVLEEGVTTIGAAAFNKCEDLTAVHLPDTLTTIEEYAFFGCCALTDVDLPASLTRLDNHVFANCASLTEISIVQGVTELKSNVFQECDQLVAVHLPVSLTHIGEKAFFGCDRLEEIRLPANVKTLGNHSFYKCVSLTSVTIGAGVTEIGSYAFYNCTSLKEIVFEGNAPTLAADALKNVIATAVYPAKAEGWEQASASSYGGTISWLAREQTVPTILLKYPTVSFEDEIVMNIYFDASDLEDVVEMGLLTYDAEVDTADITSADAVIPGYAFRDREQLFCAVSRGIAAKDMEKPLYFAVYAKLKDGTYVYTAPASYAPSTYAANLLTNGSGQMRSLMAATLSYGGAAQKYFGSNGTLSDLDRTLIESYREDMMNAVVQPDADKIGDFSGTGGFSKGYPTVSFEGAFAIRYYFTPANGVASDVQLYYWTAEDYDQAQTLTADNATGILTMEAGAEGYQAAVEGIAAKDLDDTVYVACVYSDGTNDWCSGVLAYSIGAYCTAQAAKTGALAELAAATAVYGYYARQLLD